MKVSNKIKLLFVFFVFIFFSCKKENNALIINDSENFSPEKKTSEVTNKDYKNEILDSKTPSSIKISYAGKIDQFPIEMEMIINKTTKKIEGTYRYIKNKTEKTIFINGEINNQKLILTEKIIENGNWKETGKFEFDLKNFKNISGFWKNPKETKTLKVTLTSLEKFDNLPLSYVFEADLEKNQINNSYDNDNKIEQTQLKSLKIFHENNLIQTLSNLNLYVLDNVTLVELEDLNFDSFFDLKIIEYFPDRTKYDVGFRYYIYNPESKKFISAPKLNELEYLSFNSFTKQFTKMYADGSGNESTEYYEWKGSSFKLVKKEEVFEDSAKNLITEYPY